MIYDIADSVVQFFSRYGIDIADLFEKNMLALTIAILGFTVAMSGIVGYMICNLVTNMSGVVRNCFRGMIELMSTVIGGLMGILSTVIGGLIGILCGSTGAFQAFVQRAILAGINAIENSNQSFSRSMICGAIAIRLLIPLITWMILTIFPSGMWAMVGIAVSYVMVSVLMKCSGELSRFFWACGTGAAGDFNVRDLAKILKTCGSQTVKYWAAIGTLLKSLIGQFLGREIGAISDDRKAESSKPIVLEQQTPGLLPELNRG